MSVRFVSTMLSMALLAACNSSKEQVNDTKGPEVVVKLPAYIPLYPGAEVETST